MPRKSSHITVTDQFCGAGGSSQGVRRLSNKHGGGIEVKLALNHWKLAIETHNTNFPDTLHDCTDISACDPRRYNSTDILITSPECTNHSLAKGVKIIKKQMDLYAQGKIDPSAERSRATMWDVCRFAEYHNYNAIIVENVVDARKWVMFDAWLHAMLSLGYCHKCVYLNSMHCHPTPQSRDRMYVVFWKKANKAPVLDYMPAAHCPKCRTDVRAVQTWKNPLKKYGKYRQQYVYCCPNDGVVVEPYYYASFNCIDWSDLGGRIGDRKKPLSKSTIKRINYGFKKYGSQPMLSINYTPGYCKPLLKEAATVTSQDHHGLVVPFIIKAEHSNQFNVRSVTESFQTQTTRQSMGLVTHESWRSFFASYYNGSNCTKHFTEELGSITTSDRHYLINYQEPNIEDCYYRMLKAGEVKLAMAFDSNYVILGNSRDQVKQCGNAVTPPAMEWLVQQVVESFN
jgi:DNA (cytosine-5)-methyltransferase 1